MSEKRYNITRKVQLYPVGDKDEVSRVYKYLKDGIEAQNRAMNQYMSNLYVEAQMKASEEDRKELHRLYGRISTSSKGSAYSSDIVFPKGLPTTSSLAQKVFKDFCTAMKSGLMYGSVSLPTYRDTNPLLIHVDYVRLMNENPHMKAGLYHNYESDAEFKKNLYTNNANVFIKFANDITFQVIFGSVNKSHELRTIFEKIFASYYLVGGSSIEIKKNKIILNLALSAPEEKHELDENVVVGVDLGIAVPAVCAVNTSEYIKSFIGSKSDFLAERKKMQEKNKRLAKSLAFTSGGHGLTKKIKPLERLDEEEKNWVTTYNHNVSKKIVDFALKNHAKYINIEDLSGFGKNEKHNVVLRNWSYYQLQNFITYKANRAGITVRKVDAYMTSQTCSCCNHLEEGQRISQDTFVCKNPECKNFNKKINADFNAARNIAESTAFTEEKKKKKKEKKEKKAIA